MSAEHQIQTLGVAASDQAFECAQQAVSPGNLFQSVTARRLQ
ncbi:hypothetical protein AZ54_12340 [Xanthomonas oryzae pv. oryzae PXO86]|nr:hypothetical protein AZ54_12340 [Xanthomonas oryzae pv. oryzae PXO86]